MSDSDAAVLLEQALDKSRELLGAAERGDTQAVARLDAERRELLQSARRGGAHFERRERSLVQQVALLNDQAIGQLEHHRRIKGRALDLAAVGRRAMHAYGHTRTPR